MPTKVKSKKTPKNQELPLPELPQAVWVALNKVKLNPDNPRVIGDTKFRNLVKSLKDFPQMLGLRPIVVDENGMILGGNMRYQAAKSAGLKHVPIIRAADLTDEQKEEFIIKDNVPFGEWNYPVLQSQWGLDKVKGWGLDIPKQFLLDGEEPDLEIDENELEKRRQIYLNATIKQIVLYYDNDEFENVMERLDNVSKAFGVDNNSEAVVKLLDFHQKNQ